MEEAVMETSSSSDPRVAVIGGGLAGLVAALTCAVRGLHVSVFEESDRFGGSIHTQHEAGFTVEHGAEGFAAESPSVLALSAELGLTAALESQLVHRSCAFDGQGLYALDAGEAAARLGLSQRSKGGDGIKTFRCGMQQLTEAIVERLRGRVQLRLQTRVRSISRSTSGWQLDWGESCGQYDAVVLATSARIAGELLAPSFGADASELRNAVTLPSLSVSLAYRKEALPLLPDAAGFVLDPGVTLDGCIAATFTSVKFRARAPNDFALIRLFFRPTPDELLHTSECIRDRAERVVARVFPGCGSPVRTWEARWRDGIAVVDAEQRARIARLERLIDGNSIVLAGSAFHGSGIECATRSGTTALCKLPLFYGRIRQRAVAFRDA
jgi:oxygen-dependent protoporphyrinogen oxidase